MAPVITVRSARDRDRLRQEVLELGGGASIASEYGLVS